jgi:hypothetical protein
MAPQYIDPLFLATKILSGYQIKKKKEKPAPVPINSTYLATVSSTRRLSRDV